MNVEFEKLASLLGSTFAAINYVACMARIKLIENNNQILQSQAISWVLTGNEPKYKTQKIDPLSQTIRPIIDEMLCYIDDELVRESIRCSYEASVKADHLIYMYHPDLPDGYHAKVRIILNMIWENIYDEGGSFYER